MLTTLKSITAYEIPEMKGCYQIKHFSGDHLIGVKGMENEYPDKDAIGSYGVCDSPKQFMEDYGAILEDDPENKFVVFFTHVAKTPGKKDGWRWHKWGEYVGKGTPTTEYLDDEQEFDEGVYVYHFYRVNYCDENYNPDQQLATILQMIGELNSGN